MDISGKHVVVTGTIPGESRQTAELKLTQAGALVQRQVNGRTDLLITGAKVGASKMAAAHTHGASVISWAEAWGASASGPTPPATTAPAPAPLIAPMLAKAGDLPDGLGWTYEVKWDGVRALARIEDGAVAIQSRSGKTDYALQYPEISADLARLGDGVIDGEIVVLDESGISGFQELRGPGGAVASFIAFDVLEREGIDLRDRPLAERRGHLRAHVRETGALAISPVFDDGERLLRAAASHGLEGLVAKHGASTYLEGSRGGDWIKVKLRREQEFVVIGWTPLDGALDRDAGALLLAVNDAQGLRYCGKVGTGLTTAEWDALTGPLTPAPGPVVDESTLDIPAAKMDEVTWVDPQAVVQVRFQRWTKDGRLWHPSLAGVRHDKAWHEVVREEVSA